jgi:hypothetical protein
MLPMWKKQNCSGTDWVLSVLSWFLMQIIENMLGPRSQTFSLTRREQWSRHRVQEGEGWVGVGRRLRFQMPLSWNH